MRRLGYARVSSHAQSLAAQVDQLAPHCDRVLRDIGSGARAADSRPGFAELQRWLEPGDLVVVWRLDRLGRRAYETARIVAEWTERGIWVQSLSEGFRTDHALAPVLVPVLTMVAEWERTTMLERQEAGRRAGRPPGRRVAVTTAQAQWARAELAAGRYSKRQLAQQLGASVRSLSRALDRLPPMRDARQTFMPLGEPPSGSPSS